VPIQLTAALAWLAVRPRRPVTCRRGRGWAGNRPPQAGVIYLRHLSGLP